MWYRAQTVRIEIAFKSTQYLFPFHTNRDLVKHKTEQLFPNMQFIMFKQTIFAWHSTVIFYANLIELRF